MTPHDSKCHKVIADFELTSRAHDTTTCTLLLSAPGSNMLHLILPLTLRRQQNTSLHWSIAWNPIEKNLWTVITTKWPHNSNSLIQFADAFACLSSGHKAVYLSLWTIVTITSTDLICLIFVQIALIVLVVQALLDKYKAAARAKQQEKKRWETSVTFDQESQETSLSPESGVFPRRGFPLIEWGAIFVTTGTPNPLSDTNSNAEYVDHGSEKSWKGEWKLVQIMDGEWGRRWGGREGWEKREADATDWQKERRPHLHKIISSCQLNDELPLKLADRTTWMQFVMRLPEKTHKLLFDALFSPFHPQWVPGEDFASPSLNFYKTQHTIEQAFCFILSILFYRRSNGKWFRLLKFWQDYTLFPSADAKVSLNCGTCYRNIFSSPFTRFEENSLPSPWQSVCTVISGRHLFVFVPFLPFASFFPFLQCVSMRFKCPKRLSRWYMDLICMKISVC